MIGTGIITYNREKQFSRIKDSIKHVDVVFSIKDGGKDKYSVPVDVVLDTNVGVGKCKNITIQSLLEKGCEHIFLLEDDCLIKDNRVWEYCIEFSQQTGLLHFNWNDYRYDKIGIAEWGNLKASLCYNTEANFSYFHKSFLEKITFDENYFNGWEHADLELQADRLGFAPSFGIFISPFDLSQYLELIDDGESTITGKSLEYMDRIQKGRNYFNNKWGKDIMELYDFDMINFKNKFKEIKQKYGRK